MAGRVILLYLGRWGFKLGDTQPWLHKGKLSMHVKEGREKERQRERGRRKVGSIQGSAGKLEAERGKAVERQRSRRGLTRRTGTCQVMH